LVALGEAGEHVADALVLVDVAPHIEPAGVAPIRAFMSQGLNGFATLEDAADAIARYVPHRPRPRNLDGLRKNLRQHADERWYWHWDPRFIEDRGGIDGQAGLLDTERYARAAAGLRVPTLLVRGRMSDVVSDESVQHLKELVPGAEVVDVTGAGHMVAGDRNDAFNTAVIEFIDRIVPL
jgi:pimeloyl-ACP methyl ester carboxylesterase